MFAKIYRKGRQPVISFIGAVAASTLCLGIAAAPVHAGSSTAISQGVPAGQAFI